MTTYIALLRGINVGGHRVKMEELRRLFAELGLANVRTYIQTGNVFFASDEPDRAALTARIEQHLAQALGYAVPTFLRTPDELEELLTLNAFGHLAVTDNMRLCLMLLKEPAPTGLSLPLLSPKGDMEIIHLTGHEAFVVWHLLDGRAPAGTTFLDKLLGRQTTTRFLHTTAKILEAARQG
ncbi:DUF1697 domain-containing protein [Hymenobacter sp. BT175]|uniref:DUF1697 domain-containing protein n=1 Tax=Hymenobacter translucens TaxID=2886507 RepID=UPI001D0E77DA|nr:DUF1697 domain-containing protein [Hymenobacter translucens]MCC2547377.1 DUF1697 domain-containing protein [Hymenobacter translucens]